MELTTDIVRHIQRKLGFSEADIDGKMGRQTDGALNAFLTQNRDKISERHRDGVFSGGRKRRATAFGQIVCQEHDIEAGLVDGLLGTQSFYAFQVLLFIAEHGRKPHAWRDHIDIPNPNNWPGDSQQALVDHYGDPGRNGTKVPLKRIDLPYVHRLSWDKSSKVKEMKCHELVADSVGRCLTKV
ncbi:MAG: hypothetical protein KDC54_16020, partial [Lewinella sp.]|nr:hypothetical protein [Lewinella sp.]